MTNTNGIKLTHLGQSCNKIKGDFFPMVYREQVKDVTSHLYVFLFYLLEALAREQFLAIFSQTEKVVEQGSGSSSA